MVSNRSFRILCCAVLVLAVALPGLAAGKKTKVDTPAISCGTSTQASLDIVVCAPGGVGATGLPAGFSIQWMTAADYAANGNQWYTSDDTRLCKASFSGNASGTRYALLPGECATVRIGDLLFDNGTSSSCVDALLCGTDYVFHSFGHATNTLNRSDFTANLTCTTLPCTPPGGCTLTQGYWKTHCPDAACAAAVVPYPVSSLSLGTVAYTDLQLVSILKTPASGNGLIILAHQLIAAKLNIANGADGSAIAADIAAADALIGSLVVPPVGSGSLSAGATSGLVTSLNNYNTGLTGPGHCPSEN
jgi:hypothetical protein